VDLDLRDRVAIVTGGSRGIGKAVARELASEGAHVAVVARGREALEATAAEISAETGRRVVPIAADTTSDASVRAMVERVVATFGRLDILVNGAAQPGGQAPPPKLGEITEDLVWSDLNTKVLGYLRCAREVAPHMIARRWGRIINIGGLAARSSGATITSLRNAAVVALTKNLADELGPYGINVTVVHPGLTWTERMPDLLADTARRLGISVEEAERRLAERNAIRRIVTAREVAHVVAFLASPRSIAITGDVIAVGGGGPGIYY
jgi:NAD(P)-dependent dehydrogenase (short-subunit alcohol dehydrogenase family)